MVGNPRAVVFGCQGESLSIEEAHFFREANPLGFILFARNCVEPVQVAALVASLRETVDREDAPVMIDQEGGRVARLKPPHWPSYSAARTLGDIADRDPQAATEAVRLNCELIGSDLRALGITINCAPTVDVPVAGAHEMIGNRAYGVDPARVAALGRAACEGLLAANVLPIVKHLPGYGRARVDSHGALPFIGNSIDILEATDFVPFRALKDMPWGMTAHALYSALDVQRPATVSPAILGDIIRKRIGFAGILITDDLSMKALQGTLAERAEAALAAGCDVALHCNGKLAEMRAITAALVTRLPDKTLGMIADAEIRRKAGIPGHVCSVADARSQLQRLLT